MDMSETPFTNIKTCNGELDAQAEDSRSCAYETPPTPLTALTFSLCVPQA